ncbi:MAG: TetR/AcrR family transcriptional regulator [Firmicutes bacterium]|nr:TetR/AcrR family transcriptional regulator [Bacillota bacterium]
MERKKTDRRVRKTKHQLRQGLAKLMLEKSIKEITVKELTQLVDVNRGTFYLHYKDIYDMVDQLENEIMTEFRALLETVPDQEASRQHQLPSILPLFTSIYTYLAENADLCAVFLGENGDIAFVEKIKGLVRDSCFRTWAAWYPDVEPQRFEWFYAFVVGGHIGLIQNWLSTGMKESPEEIAALAEDMAFRGAGCLQKP